MEILKEMPASGQFIVVHEYESVIWSTTLRWEGGVLETYIDGKDEFMDIGHKQNPDHNSIYISHF